MTRRKVTSKFKTKVALEALKERETAQDLAQRFGISPQQVNLWKREFLAQAESVFTKGAKSTKSEAEEKEDRLLKVIGKQKVEMEAI